MHAGTPPLLVLEDVIKQRSQGGSLFELRVPSFTIEAGQLIALVGDSGCGKSTLLDLMSMIMEPTQVRRFDLHPGTGRDMSDIGELWSRHDEAALAGLRRDYLGYVLQTGGLLSFLSVRDNINLPNRIKGLHDGPARIETLAGRLGVAGCLDRMPDSLSIGQRQRVAILRAIIHRPRLLLADEPTAAVDKGRARAILDDMHALARDESMAVIVVTHDVDLIATHADRTYTFDISQISAQETRSICRPLEPDARS